MKTYQAIARAISEEGCTAAYTLVGDANMLIMGALRSETETTLVHARHEISAVAMADGYARVTGQVGFASVTAGPGLTNMASSLVIAARRRSPLVVLVGDTSTTASYHAQQFDQMPFVKDTGALFLRMDSGTQAADCIQRAFFLAQQRKLPVVVSVPANVQEQEFTHEWHYTPSSSFLPSPQRIHPDPLQVAEIVDAIAASERPLILAGRGAVESGAHDATVALGERIGALLGTSLRAKGWFRNDSRQIGIVGGLATTHARELISQADCIIGIGAGLSFFTTEAGDLFGDAKVIQLDTDPTGLFEGRYVAEQYLRSDALTAVEAIETALGERGHTAIGFRTAATEEVLRAAEVPPACEADESEAGYVHPAQVMRALNGVLTDDCHVVVGGGAFWSFPGNELNALPPENYTFTGDFMTIGHAIPVGVGIAMADLKRHVIVIEGDGSTMTCIQELDAIAAAGIPVMIIVINDGAYGAEVHGLNAKGLDGNLARFPRKNFAALAEAFGVDGVQLSDAAEISGVVQKFMTDRRPVVVDVPMSSRVISPVVRRAKFGQVRLSDLDRK